MSELEDFVGHGGREKERLSFGGHLLQDSFDVGSEADIEHSVGFIEDDDADSGRVEMAPSHHVNDSAGGTDDNLRARAKFANLSIESLAAVDAGHLEAEIADEFFPFLMDLVDQFSRWAEDEDLGEFVVWTESLKNRQEERGGLAGSGLCLSDDVDPFECLRDEGGLDRRRLSVADTIKIGENFWPKV